MSLLPCPFCGNTVIRAVISGGSDERCGYNYTCEVSCGSCGGSLSLGTKQDSNGWCKEGSAALEKRATQAWNTRAI